MPRLERFTSLLIKRETAHGIVFGREIICAYEEIENFLKKLNSEIEKQASMGNFSCEIEGGKYENSDDGVFLNRILLF